MRETETWVPMKTTQTAAMLAPRGPEGSGSDFGFTDDYEDEDEDDYEDTDDYADNYGEDDEDDGEFSGSGDGGELPTPPASAGTRPRSKHTSVSIATTTMTPDTLDPSAEVSNAPGPAPHRPRP